LWRKFNNKQSAHHTAEVRYKHLRAALQLLVNFKLFSYLVISHTCATFESYFC